MTETGLKHRTKQFALRVLRLVDALPNRVSGANYRAACRGRSRADFVSKLGIVVEEADESGYWLELVIEGSLVKKKLVQPLLDEANELLAIFVASHRSACLRSAEMKKGTGRKNKAAP